MAETSKIEWTHHTFNGWIGCTKVHEGCKHCYAEADFDTRRHVANWGPQGTRVVTSVANWRKPLKWNEWAATGVCWHCHGKSLKPTDSRCRVCDGTGNIGPYRARVFCSSLADVFEDWDGPLSGHDGCWDTLDEGRQALFKLIDATPYIDWLLLTKRPENILSMWPRFEEDRRQPSSNFAQYDDGHRPNVWLGTSVSLQEHADKQIPALLTCRDLSPVLFLSVEPLLGPIDLGKWTRHTTGPEWQNGGGPNECRHGIRSGIDCADCLRLDWIICGGESGHKARPMNPDWVRALRDQCEDGGVPFFFKQWGEWSPWEADTPPLWMNASGTNAVDRHTLPDLTDHEEHAGWWWPCDPEHLSAIYHRVGKKDAGALLDGTLHREFPTVASASSHAT